MSLAAELLAALDKFRNLVAGHVNSGQLVTIDDHINTIANVAEGDVQAADAKAQQVLGELYGALHGQTAAPTETPSTTAVDGGQAVAAVPGTAPATADATPAKTAATAPATTGTAAQSAS